MERTNRWQKPPAGRCLAGVIAGYRAAPWTERRTFDPPLARGETAGDYAGSMSRFLDPLVLGPPGVCDACGRYCCTLDQVGIPCYHCESGVFVHRRFWTFSMCPFCSGAGNTSCLACRGSCIVAAPDEALDPLALAADRRCAVERYCAFLVFVAYEPAAIGSMLTATRGRDLIRSRCPGPLPFSDGPARASTLRFHRPLAAGAE